MSKIVSYVRVSTKRQGDSGLGLAAQRAAVAAYVAAGGHTVVAELVEVESGKRNDRPQLAAAFKACRLYGARLCVAKLDRLSRDAGFLMNLDKAGVDFVCCDNPHATRLTIGVLAVVADEERRAISLRTKAALTAAKARGQKLGGSRGHVITVAASAAGRAALTKRAADRAADIAPVLDELRAAGVTSLRAIAAELMMRGVPAARGGATWTAAGVARVLAMAA